MDTKGAKKRKPRAPAKPKAVGPPPGLERAKKPSPGGMPSSAPPANVEALRAGGFLGGGRKVVGIVQASSDSESSEEVWDLRRILEESPAPYIVREFIRANVECIVDGEEEGLFAGHM